MHVKRFTSIALSAAMVFSIAAQAIPAVTQFAFASGYEWTAPADSSGKTTSDMNGLGTSDKFTYEEWTGKTNGSVYNYNIVETNRIAQHTTATSVPYQDLDTAISGARDYDRGSSDYVQMLTGEDKTNTDYLWDLTVVENWADAQNLINAGVTGTSYSYTTGAVTQQYGEWSTQTVPASWTSYGYDYTIYTNTKMPWQPSSSLVSCPYAPGYSDATQYNPVGFYRKDFTLDSNLLTKSDGGRVFISFQGVESAYYVYINGQQVGYSEDSYRPAEFDITDYINESSSNTLVVQVHKFCDGTWMEDQDMLYDGGIFRDVFLYSTNAANINDYTVSTDLDADYENANLDLSLDLQNFSDGALSGFKVNVSLFDTADNNILGGGFGVNIDVGSIAANGTLTVSDSIYVSSPDLWSPEDPNLYTLVLTLYNSDGSYSIASQQLGFREIEFTSTDWNYSSGTNNTSSYQNITINGQPLLMKGTNRHDRDPMTGKYVQRETYETDIMLMQQYNINAIRTSHYSNDEYLYYLADKYGMFVMAETNAECHAIMSNNTTINTYMWDVLEDRTISNYQTLKNQTSVVMWSIGNEMSYVNSGTTSTSIFAWMINYFKTNDFTRPIHSEGQSSDSLGVDMGSNMYPAVSTVQGRASYSNNIPYVICEYAHAMGNAVGNLWEYWEAIRSSENMIGAFVWDWVDQSMPVSLSSLSSSENVNYITDQSNNGVTGTVYGDIADTTDMAAIGTKSGSGYTIMDSSYNSLYNQYLGSGATEFTFEVIVKPNSTSLNSVFLSKGDRQVALKTGSSGTTIEFFVSNGSNWGALNVDMPSDFAGNWHQIVGIYDSHTLRIYYDGTLLGTTTTSYSISDSTNNLAVGYDDYEGRKLDGEISIARIYTKALTQAEVVAQYSAAPAITANDASVLLWIDYSTPLSSDTITYGYWDYYSESCAKSYLYQNELSGSFLGMGGDWGDTSNDGNFAQNGLISPDRTPQPELQEVKYVYQSVWFTSDDISSKEIEVYNEFSFTNLSEYDITWELLENGKAIDSGTLDLDVEPRATATVSVPFDMPALSDRPEGAEYYLNLSVKVKAVNATDFVPAGHEIAYEQIKVPATAIVADVPSYGNDVAVVDGNDSIYVTSSGFSFSISKTTGAIENYYYNGALLLEEGPTPNFWRARNNNDTSSEYNSGWKTVSNTAAALDDYDISVDNDGRPVIWTSLDLANETGSVMEMTYTINSNGEITVDYYFNSTSSSLSNASYGGPLAVGTEMTTASGLENVTWYGSGYYDNTSIGALGKGYESYSDRNHGAKQGIWEYTVSDFYYPFLQVQDSGRLADTQWIAVENAAGTGVLIAGDSFEASTLHFTDDELDDAYHPYDLSPNDETTIGIDMVSKGNGNNSCGANVLSDYRIWNGEYEYQFTIIPYSSTTAPDSDSLMSLSTPYRAASGVVDLTDSLTANDVTVSSITSGYPGHNTIDNDTDTYWVSANNTVTGVFDEQWVAYDFSEVKYFDTIVITARYQASTGRYWTPKVVEIQTSDDGVNWTTQYTFDLEYKLTNTLGFDYLASRYVRILVTEAWSYSTSGTLDNPSNNVQIAEVEIYEASFTLEDSIVYAAAYVGDTDASSLPTTVQAVSSGGSHVDVSVDWEVDASSFTKKYETVEIAGTIPGGTAVTAYVEVIPEKLVYFVDSNGVATSSPIYTAISELVSGSGSGLLNQIADQAYTSGSTTWGYTGSSTLVGVARSDGAYNKYISGGYYGNAGNVVGTTISYFFELPAGTYELTAGTYDWWSTYGGRTFSAVITYTTSSGSPKTVSMDDFVMTSSNAYATQTSDSFILDETTTVTFTLASTTADDPVISWIGIEDLSVDTPDPISSEDLSAEDSSEDIPSSSTSSSGTSSPPTPSSSSPSSSSPSSDVSSTDGSSADDSDADDSGADDSGTDGSSADDSSGDSSTDGSSKDDSTSTVVDLSKASDSSMGTGSSASTGDVVVSTLFLLLTAGMLTILIAKKRNKQ